MANLIAIFDRENTRVTVIDRKTGALVKTWGPEIGSDVVFAGLDDVLMVEIEETCESEWWETDTVCVNEALGLV